MLDSLRSRVLVWYTALFGVVILAFGATVSLIAWRARLAEVDGDLMARAEAFAAGIEPAGDGTFDLAPPADAPPVAPGVARYYVVWAPDGRVIDRSDPGLYVPAPSGPGARPRGDAREAIARSPHGPLVLVGRSIDDVRAEIRVLAGRLTLVGLTALALAFGGGWLLVGGALRPINRISATARAMTAGDFGARIPASDVDTELGQLARALNEAFDRLHAALERQRRFTADASHELRTPLATMSTEVQWALGRDREPAEYRESLEVCRRAAGRMTAMVERLLVLARAETGPDTEPRETVSADAVARRVVDDVRPLAARQHVTIELERERVSVMGNAGRLQEALTNIVVNAVQYNREGGCVTVVVGGRGGEAVIEVRDTGIGIAPGDALRVFEPFYRADAARSRDAGGAGLGLAVARTIVERHGGRISCASEPGVGTTISVALPRVFGSDQLVPDEPERR